MKTSNIKIQTDHLVNFSSEFHEKSLNTNEFSDPQVLYVKNSCDIFLNMINLLCYKDWKYPSIEIRVYYGHFFATL